MHARTDEYRKQSTMDPVTFSRRIAKLEYKAVRWPFTVLDDRVITRHWGQDALLRSGFQRFLGSLDRFAGWLLADDAISQRGQNLLRQTQDTGPAPEPAAEHLAPEDQTAEEPAAEEPAAEEPAAAEPAAAEPAAMESAPREAAIDEPPTEELTLAELAGPAVRDQAGEPLATAAEPATVGTVDVTFTLPGEVGAGHVALCGDFNNWTAGKSRSTEAATVPGRPSFRWSQATATATGTCWTASAGKTPGRPIATSPTPSAARTQSSSSGRRSWP